MLHKIYGPAIAAPGRYSPAGCIGTQKKRIEGNPDAAHVSTPYVERQNLTMRMSIRRFTRLTNAFSMKLDNHIHALALYFASYNFCRIHKTVRTSPANGRRDRGSALVDGGYREADRCRRARAEAARPLQKAGGLSVRNG